MSEVIDRPAAPANGNGGKHALVEVLHSGDVVEQANAMVSRALEMGNIEALERLIAMRDRDIDRQREIAANQDFVRMRGDIPVITGTGKVNATTRRGSNINYGFAQLAEDIDPAISPPMKQHGFQLRFRPVEQTPDYVDVEGELIHERTGWSWKSKRREWIDKEAFMGLAQKGGAAQTFAIRYLTVAMLSLRIRGEDTDGRPANDDYQAQREAKRQASSNTYTATRDDEREHGNTGPRGESGAGGEDFAAKAINAPDTWIGKTERSLLRYQHEPGKWLALFEIACGKAHNTAEIDQLQDLKLTVAMLKNAPPDARTRINVALGAARKALSGTAKPPVYRAPLLSADGEILGEYATPLAFARAFMELWRGAMARDSAEAQNISHHNGETIITARASDPAADRELAALDGPTWEPPGGGGKSEQTEAESGATDSGGFTGAGGFVYEAVQPPLNNGIASWPTWERLIRDEIATCPPWDFEGWLAAQRSVLEACPAEHRTKVMLALSNAIAEAQIPTPSWLEALNLPAKSDDEVWVERLMAQIEVLPITAEGKQQFLELTTDADTRNRMSRLSRENKPLYSRLWNAMLAKNKLLPASAPTGGR